MAPRTRRSTKLNATKPADPAPSVGETVTARSSNRKKTATKAKATITKATKAKSAKAKAAKATKTAKRPNASRAKKGGGMKLAEPAIVGETDSPDLDDPLPNGETGTPGSSVLAAPLKSGKTDRDDSDEPSIDGETNTVPIVNKVNKELDEPACVGETGKNNQINKNPAEPPKSGETECSNDNDSVEFNVKSMGHLMIFITC